MPACERAPYTFESKSQSILTHGKDLMSLEAIQMYHFIACQTNTYDRATFLDWCNMPYETYTFYVPILKVQYFSGPLAYTSLAERRNVKIM